MLLIIWIVLGVVLGLIASKIVSTTGEGTVVDILLGIVARLSEAGFSIYLTAGG